jgi:hypothetical protein
MITILKHTIKHSLKAVRNRCNQMRFNMGMVSTSLNTSLYASRFSLSTWSSHSLHLLTVINCKLITCTHLCPSILWYPEGFKPYLLSISTTAADNADQLHTIPILKHTQTHLSFPVTVLSACRMCFNMVSSCWLFNIVSQNVNVPGDQFPDNPYLLYNNTFF